MMTKTTAIIPVDQNLLLEMLQELLEKQIKLLRKGDPAGKKFEELSFAADALVKKITQQDFFRSDKFAAGKNNYKNCMIAFIWRYRHKKMKRPGN